MKELIWHGLVGGRSVVEYVENDRVFYQEMLK